MKIRKDGLISIEGEIENPEASPIFSEYKNLLANKTALDFICDNLKVIISSNMPPHEMENLMEVDMEAHHHETMIPAHSVAKVADSLPGFGIVAAVLGVVLTMGKIDQPPEVLGHSIGAALVGTFLGVLMCYGFVGPMAANLEHQAKENESFFNVIKVAIVAFVGGSAPQLAVEFGRRAIPGKERPGFNELEQHLRK
jgi:chemotaxis protein MotA